MLLRKAAGSGSTPSYRRQPWGHQSPSGQWEAIRAFVRRPSEGEGRHDQPGASRQAGRLAAVEDRHPGAGLAPGFTVGGFGHSWSLAAVTLTP